MLELPPSPRPGVGPPRFEDDMSAKKAFPAALVLAVLLCGAAPGQGPTEALPAPAVEGPFQNLIPDVTGIQGPGTMAAPGSAGGQTGQAPPGNQSGLPAPSDYITYRRPFSCYCPIGGDGPIQTELYLRAGVNFPFGPSLYGRALTTGWEIQGGARVLLFDPDMTSAFVVDLGIVNTWNHANRPDIQTTLILNETNPLTGVTGPTPMTVTPDDLNRTMASAGIGREWWLTAPASRGGTKLRWGFDFGGRYGSASAQFHEIRHREDTIGAAYVALHADLEMPCGGCCVFYTGLRTEYSYTWVDILQGNFADVQDVSVMLSFGVRF
jgi:hypothetical protein